VGLKDIQGCVRGICMNILESVEIDSYVDALSVLMLVDQHSG
jgi:hypothetical protein